MSTPVSMVVVIGLLAAGCVSSTQGHSRTNPQGVQEAEPLEGRRQQEGIQGPSSSNAAPPTYSLGHFPDAPTDPFSGSTEDALQAVVDAAVGPGRPGISATVMSAGGGVWTGAAGTADGEHPVEAGSQFNIASITKAFIAAEVMRLSEEGVVRLTDPVTEYLPASLDFDTNGATIENLLAMESGIPDPGLYGPDTDPLRTWEDWEILDSVPAVRYEPGTQFVYENTSYHLLGMVIEETTGTSVAAALRAHVLADPRFSAMAYQPEERPKGPLALPFLAGRVRPNILELGGGYLPSKAAGDGSIASDSASLALWGYLLFGTNLLSERSLLKMTDFGSGNDYDGYGLGTFDQTNLGEEGFGVEAIGNGGWDPGGYSTILSVLPSKGIVISVMTNEGGYPPDLVLPVAEKLASSLENGQSD